ncbi:hypothetical protein QFZ64_005958 [Streptomyces sp. B3I8]|nr:hypothetical protein [Streptomyces sp. B3I8]
MQNRTLRSQGLEVAAIGYGAMGLTMAYGPTDAEAGVAALRRAHDRASPSSTPPGCTAGAPGPSSNPHPPTHRRPRAPRRPARQGAPARTGPGAPAPSAT